MPEPTRAYHVSLCYEAYFGKSMDVEADSLVEACESAMERADDDDDWKDTFVSSTHWIECIDYGAELVPEAFSAAAIRCGGAVLVVHRLRDALFSLVHACERNPGLLKEVVDDIKCARALLEALPDRIAMD